MADNVVPFDWEERQRRTIQKQVDAARDKLREIQAADLNASLERAMALRLYELWIYSIWT